MDYRQFKSDFEASGLTQKAFGCGWRAEYPNCDITLTYHKYFDETRCH